MGGARPEPSEAKAKTIWAATATRRVQTMGDRAKKPSERN